MSKLAGKNILITGASQGLGREMALRFAKEGADGLSIVARHADQLNKVRDEAQIAEVRKKITGKYKLKLEPPFRCDFHDPWGNRIQVVDLHDESLIWLLPYREVQKAGIKFEQK